MKRISSNLVLFSLLFLVGFSIKGQEKKNILFLMADDFNYWTSKDGYYPAAETPNLDALADKGVFFNDAHCASPVCNPSRNAMLSGFRPSTTGISTNGGGFVRHKEGFENIVTLHQYFMDNGYFTHAAGKIWHPGTMGDEETDPTHWDSLDKSNSGCNGGDINRFFLTTKSNYGWSANERVMNENNCGDYHLAMNTARLIEGYDTSKNKDKPFFIACGVFRPHMAWHSPLSFWEEFDPADMVVPKGYNNEVGNDIHQEIVDNDKWMEAIHAYLASCKLADYNIGVMLDALENSPYKDNTIVVFMGDHGWHLGEKGHWGKYSTWNEANHTTMIIYDPSAEGNGQVCEKVVSMQDIYPTLVELSGLAPKTDIEGRSLTPLLEDPSRQDWDWPVMMTYAGTDYIKTNEYRFVKDGNNSRLYDMKADPYEWNNLYGQSQYGSVVQKLSAQIDSMKEIGQELRKKLLKNNSFEPNALSIPGIIEAEDYDEGASGLTYYDLTKGNEGGVYRDDNVDIEITDDSDGAYHVTSMNEGEWLQYTIQDFENGKYELKARVRNSNPDVVVLKYFIGDQLIGETGVPGGTNGWIDVPFRQFSIDSNNFLRFRVMANSYGVDLNYLKFVAFDDSNPVFTIKDDGSSKFLMSNVINDNTLQLDLTYSSPVVKMEIYNSQGMKVDQDLLTGEIPSTYKLNSGLSNGIYFAKFYDAKGAVVEKFFIR